MICRISLTTSKICDNSDNDFLTNNEVFKTIIRIQSIIIIFRVFKINSKPITSYLHNKIMIFSNTNKTQKFVFKNFLQIYKVFNVFNQIK